MKPHPRPTIRLDGSPASFLSKVSSFEGEKWGISKIEKIEKISVVFGLGKLKEKKRTDNLKNRLGGCF